MNRRVFLALASFCFLASSAFGMQIDITQNIDKEGNAKTQVTVDKSSISGSQSWTCDEFYSNTDWKSPNCSVEAGKVIMRGTVSLKNSLQYVVKRSVPYITYTYDTKATDVILEMTGAQTDNTSDETGLKADYTIEMPGEMVRTEIGKVGSNKAQISALELAGKEHAYVESRELNVSWIIGLVSFIPIMLFVSYVAGRKQKKRDY